MPGIAWRDPNRGLRHATAALHAATCHRGWCPSGFPRLSRAWAATSRHLFESTERRERAEKYCSRLSFGPAHDVRGVVHAVGEVDVKVPRRTEHRRVPRGLGPERVRCGIRSTSVGLHLDNARLELTAPQQLPNQLRRDQHGVTLEEGTREPNCMPQLRRHNALSVPVMPSARPAGLRR